MNKVRIRKERFLAWLQSHTAGQVVGSTRKVNDTPIVRYLRERSKGGVSMEFRRPSDQTSYQDAGWVRDFLVNLANHRSDNVTAQTAIRLLS